MSLAQKHLFFKLICLVDVTLVHMLKENLVKVVTILVNPVSMEMKILA